MLGSPLASSRPTSDAVSMSAPSPPHFFGTDMDVIELCL